MGDAPSFSSNDDATKAGYEPGDITETNLEANPHEGRNIIPKGEPYTIAALDNQFLEITVNADNTLTLKGPSKNPENAIAITEGPL